MREKSFKIGKIFYLCYGYGFFWFRFFRTIGVYGSNIRTHYPLFSERYKRNYLQVGNWRFKILK